MGMLVKMTLAGYCREFYTGWLSHWGERLAHTDAQTTAKALDAVLQLNASVVLYVSPNPPDWFVEFCSTRSIHYFVAFILWMNHINSTC